MNNREANKDQKDDAVESEFAVEIPNGFECPVTLCTMEDPVIAADGHSYERVAIEEWLAGGRRGSPMTGEKLAHTLLTPNHALHKVIQAFLKQHPNFADLQKESYAQRSLEQQRQDLRIAIQLKEKELAVQAAKKSKGLHPAAQEAVDEKQEETGEPRGLRQAVFNQGSPLSVMEKVIAIAQQKQHPRAQISEALFRASQIEVALDKLREQNAANKIKRFYLKFGKNGLKAWMKASSLSKRQESLSHQLEQAIQTQDKQVQIFKVESEQQVSADIKALEFLRISYEIKIQEASMAGAWKKVGTLAEEADKDKEALQIRQQQAMEARLAVHQQAAQQCETEQVQLRQALQQIASAKSDKQRGLLQRVKPIAKLTTALHANGARREVFLENQGKLAAILKKKIDAQYQVKRRNPAGFFKPDEEKNALNPDQAQVETFIKLVADGQQDEAEALLKAEPLLALTYGKVIDNVGKPFKRITAIQYAAFVFDEPMWNMMIPYFTKKQCQLACEQLEELETHGTEHGKEQNWDLMMNEMKKYSDHYAHWGHAERVQQLKVIGAEQDKLAQHVVSEYCRPNRPFYPEPNFEDGIHRERDKRQEGEWKTRKGKEWIWAKGEYNECSSHSSVNIFSWVMNSLSNYSDVVKQDRKALLALSKTRRQQKEKLRHRLTEMMHLSERMEKNIVRK